MRCGYCNRTIRQGDLLHGIKYGTTDHRQEVFIPDKDSAWIYLCGLCAEILSRLIYAKLNKNSINPNSYKTFTQTR
jgi:hypothetical protein